MRNSYLKPEDVALSISLLDPSFRNLTTHLGPPPRRRRVPVSLRFATLTSAVTSQLLSTKAAATIHARVITACEGLITPTSVVTAGPETLRSVGLSWNKALTITNLAERTLEGRLRFERHGRMSDADVASELVDVRGVGPWTAQIYLMSTLARPDIWPIGDLGVRHGWTLIHGDKELISPARLLAEGENFPGVRSSVAWYCWQAVNIQRGER
ncbi:MAG: hypothetical protein WCG86_08725, partial [Actinomycetota bacterium]